MALKKLSLGLGFFKPNKELVYMILKGVIRLPIENVQNVWKMQHNIYSIINLVFIYHHTFNLNVWKFNA